MHQALTDKRQEPNCLQLMVKCITPIARNGMAKP